MTSFNKFAQMPEAGGNAWDAYVRGRQQSRDTLRNVERQRPAQTSLMENRVAQRYPFANWFMSQGDVARLDPRMAKHRQALAAGRFIPGSPVGFYRSPRGSGWTNPLGVRQWFGGSPQDETKDIVSRIGQSSTMKDLMGQYRRGYLSRSELQKLVPVNLKKIVTPGQWQTADAFRKFHEFSAKADKALPGMIEQAGKPINPWGGIPQHVIDPLTDLKRQSAGLKVGSVKVGAWDWIVNRGNRDFDVQLEKALENPSTARPFFDRMRNLQKGKPGYKWYDYLNPMKWLEMGHLSDPRGQQHMKSQIQRRLKAPDTMARMFPNRGSRAGSLFKLLGPLGIGGGAGLLTGALTGNPWIAGAGLGALGLQGWNQYRKAKDPNTWFSAFATPQSAAERQSQAKNRSFLSDVGGMLYGKSASEKRSSWFTTGLQPYNPPGESEHNEQALRLLRSHFPISQGKKSIRESTNLTFGEKFRLMNAFDQATAAETGPTGRGTTTFGKVLPSLVGAGLGWLGASLAAPVLGFDGKTKKRFGIGSAALGAILNNPHLTNRIW